jgi:hypothetical protein
MATWSAGKPLYDPADISVPTFLAHAEWDADLPNHMDARTSKSW